VSRVAAEGQEFGTFKVVGRTYRSHGCGGRGPIKTLYYKYWVCQLCGYEVSASGFFDPFPALQRHEDRGHAPCERCGAMLMNCKDGSPRRHNWRLCPEKDESYRVVSIYDRERNRAVSLYDRDRAETVT